MKKVLLFGILMVLSFAMAGYCADLRDYSGIEIAKGSFIPVISLQEISTVYMDEGSKVEFISTSDLYLGDVNVIPRNSEIKGYVEKIHEPVVGTNASMVIKINKIKFSDGFEMPMKGYIYTPNNNLIGGEETQPASYEKRSSFKQGFKPMTGYVPGPTLRMGEHKVIAAGADLIVILAGPLYITHTVTN